MKLGGVIALVVLAACIGVVAGSAFLGNASPGDAERPDEFDRKTRDLEREIASLEEENRRLRESGEADARERSRVETEVADATEALEALRAGETRVTPVELTDPTAAEETGVKAANGPRFFADEYDGALRNVDWKVVGTNMREMLEVIPSIARDLAAGKQPNPEQIGRVQQLNGPLVTAALKVQNGLPGEGVNGKFSDPSFMINAMATTLETAGLPLSEAQGTALVQTARSWMARDLQRREGYDERVWALQRLYEEAELKDGFFAEAFTVFTPEQVRTISPEDTRGRIRVDLFSSSLLYVTRIRPLQYETREGLVDEVLRGASMAFHLSETERDRARVVIADWIDSAPQDLVTHEASVLDGYGMVTAARASAWARQLLVLLRTLETDLRFDEERSATARNYPAVIVPMRAPQKVPESAPESGEGEGR